MQKKVNAVKYQLIKLFNYNLENFIEKKTILSQ